MFQSYESGIQDLRRSGLLGFALGITLVTTPSRHSEALGSLGDHCTAALSRWRHWWRRFNTLPTQCQAKRFRRLPAYRRWSSSYSPRSE